MCIVQQLGGKMLKHSEHERHPSSQSSKMKFLLQKPKSIGAPQLRFPLTRPTRSVVYILYMHEYFSAKMLDMCYFSDYLREYSYHSGWAKKPRKSSHNKMHKSYSGITAHLENEKKKPWQSWVQIVHQDSEKRYQGLLYLLQLSMARGLDEIHRRKKGMGNQISSWTALKSKLLGEKS